MSTPTHTEKNKKKYEIKVSTKAMVLWPLLVPPNCKKEDSMFLLSNDALSIITGGKKVQVSMLRSKYASK
jgi:hypothetical protein